MTTPAPLGGATGVISRRGGLVIEPVAGSEVPTIMGPTVMVVAASGVGVWPADVAVGGLVGFGDAVPSPDGPAAPGVAVATTAAWPQPASNRAAPMKRSKRPPVRMLRILSPFGSGRPHPAATA